MTHDTPQPWEQQIGESGKAFSAFQVYRDLGPRARSLTAVAQATQRQSGGGPGAGRRRAGGKIEDWSRRYRWVERAEAFDRFQDKRRQADQLEASREADKRHAMLGRGAFNIAVKMLSGLSTDHVTPSQFVQIANLAVDLERMALGRPIASERPEPANRAPGQPSPGEPYPRFKPTTAEVVEVMKGLHDLGVFQDDPDETSFQTPQNSEETHKHDNE